MVGIQVLNDAGWRIGRGTAADRRHLKRARLDDEHSWQRQKDVHGETEQQRAEDVGD